jgi:creatinine amidohydrolase/Fe(II)-dependent formamide hydrolase-like protein
MKAAFDEKPREHALRGEGLTLPLSTVDETGSGVYGTQSTASAEKGKKVLEACIVELVRHVNLLKKARMEDLMQKPKV